ncbi:N-acetylmuramoyl-L-alanine amidase [Candidatus Pacearchaeota archaeon ex4484_71]|nr:MAG: N-acetylmuramoyl-L-alanine amidase [Candidatus Pacearchaeota archaeon ex4484_71]
MEILKEVKFLAIHHSQRAEDSAKFIKERHLKRGWEDIGYHHLIDKFGKVYLGRSEKYWGAHVLGQNHHSIGICIMGNFDKEEPPKKQMYSLLKLIIEKMKEYNITVENVLGHREFPNVKKTCPGYYVNMDKIRKLINKKLLKTIPN